MFYVNKLNGSLVNPVYVVSRRYPDGSIKFAIIDKNNHQQESVRLFGATEHFSHLFNLNPSSLAQQLPGIHEKVTNPETGNTEDLYNCIMDLNDIRGWSREKIAMWIRSLPNQDRFKF